MTDKERDAVAERLALTIDSFEQGLSSVIDNMDNDEIRKRIITSTANLLENERAQKDDDALARAKARYDTLKQPYADAKKFQGAIVKYAMLVLEERGAQ